MKQIIPFSKDIQFDTKIHEVTSISLEHSLQMKSKYRITGEFILSGEYKINEISVNKEGFNYNIPFDIELDSKYNTGNVKIDIDDFYYEVLNEQVLKVNIDVLVDNLEIMEEEGDDVNNPNVEEDIRDEDIYDVKEEDYLRDNEVMNLFKEVNTKGIPLEIKTDFFDEDNVEPIKQLKPILDTFDDKNETFVTYHVHIVRESDNFESICLKYNVSREELSNYNDMSEIKLGDKIIVPAYRNEESK